MTIMMEHDHRLRWMDFDRYGRMQPAAMLDLFQELAISHAEELGIGRASMLEKNVVWVVVRAKLEVVREPKFGSVVTVRTWPHSLSRFSFIRDFSMRDEEGNLLVKATQEWVLMDFETRRFASAKDAYHGAHDFDEARAFEIKPRKISDVDTGMPDEPTYTVTPSFTDIDVNGHVNNTVYANYVVNALNPGPDGAIKTFQIDYRHEALPGVPLDLYLSENEGRIVAKALNPEGAIAFACAIELR